MQHNIDPTFSIPSLPYELLEQIFLAACEGKYHLDLESSNKMPPIQHILICVCRYWKAVAMSSVPLWSTIHVTRLSRYRQTTSSLSHRNFLSMAIRCSGTAPISCKLESLSLPTMDPVSPEHIITLLHDLLQTSNRWLSLDIKSIDLPWHILRPLQNNLAALRTLSVYFNPVDGSPETNASLSRLFSCAPLLSDVHVKHGDFVYDLPFNQIRKLAITTMSPSNDDSALLIPYLTKISTASPDLDTLDIDGHFTSVPSTQFPIHFPRLRKLVLRQGDLSRRLLRLLHLPALSYIHMSCTISQSHMELLLELIPRCRCDIRTLDIEFHGKSRRILGARGWTSSHKLGGDGVLLTTLAPHIPMLEELHLKVWGLHDSFLETLLRFVEAQNCLPQLRVLHIVGRLIKGLDNGHRDEAVVACVRRLAFIEEVARTRSEWCTKGLESISVSLMVDNDDKEHDIHKSRFFLSQLPSFRAMASLAPSVSLSLSCVSVFVTLFILTN